jgi:hypothetical protein
MLRLPGLQLRKRSKKRCTTGVAWSTDGGGLSADLRIDQAALRGVIALTAFWSADARSNAVCRFIQNSGPVPK